ncbi:MAG TPA: GNAT family N-acetyltransferase [Pelobium sp.]|nr:GNAT family N-acetyltransferase [Pelobium sp.]
MMEIRFAGSADAEVISKLANEIWPKTYAGVISDEQICFMLAEIYSIDSIERQIKAGHIFMVLETGGVLQGFASISKQSEKVHKLEKLYLHPSIHHRGAGKLLIGTVEDYCRTQGASELLLNVNRNNKAKFFYDKMGYKVVEKVDITYHQFVLNDYVMSKDLHF